MVQQVENAQPAVPRAMDVLAGSPEFLPSQKLPIVLVMERYTKIRQLGDGGQATVFLAEHKASKQLVALKVGKPGADEDLLEEAKLLMKIPRHEGIVQLLGCYEDYQGGLRQTCLVLPYCPCGDLMEYMYQISEKGRKSTPEAFIWHVFCQLSEAVAFLHTGHKLGCPTPENWTPIIHGDIKIENILLTPPSPGGKFPNLVLADFGAAKEYVPGLDEDEYYMDCGTPECWPPEAPYASPAADVWAIGVVIHQLARVVHPKANWRQTAINHGCQPEIEHMHY